MCCLCAEAYHTISDKSIPHLGDCAIDLNVHLLYNKQVTRKDSFNSQTKESHCSVTKRSYHHGQPLRS